MTKKKTIFFVIVLLGLIAAYGYYEYSRPLADLSSAKSVAQLNANDLYKEFENNETKANEKYLDKVISVEGDVLKIENKNNKQSIYLLTESMMSSIICEMDDNHKTTSVTEGQKIQIKGLCTGYLMDVILVRCVIE
ncbi:MAG: hypothetical protein HKN51_00045 [Saprospiraceae bacterium]|nr:hypothetical protein [Saprospiraceae bacterium]